MLKNTQTPKTHAKTEKNLNYNLDILNQNKTNIIKLFFLLSI